MQLTTSARFTTDLAKLLVRTTDCLICSNCQERWGKKARLPWPLLPGSSLGPGGPSSQAPPLARVAPPPRLLP